MSEYTSIYLRRKDIPFLQYKEQPNWDEIKNLSDAEREKLNKEWEEYNKNVHKSFGCELFYLSTTPSRQLTVLPWGSNPKMLTEALLDEVIDFYNEEIEECKKAIAKQKEHVARLEARIARANIELYDKISDEIDECNSNISFWETEFENYQYFYNKFDFLKGIIEDKSNAESYELIYTKC